MCNGYAILILSARPGLFGGVVMTGTMAAVGVLVGIRVGALLGVNMVGLFVGVMSGMNSIVVRDVLARIEVQP